MWAQRGHLPQGGKLSLYPFLLSLHLHVGRGVRNFKQIFTQAGPGPRSVQGPSLLLKTIIKLRSAAAAAAAAIIMCLQLQYLGQHLCKINNPPHVSIHPSILHRRRQAEWRGEWGEEEYLAYRSLCFAGQQLIWNRPPNISAHTYRNERSSSSASALSPLSLPHFFCWQHDLHFVSSSFSSLICISRSNLHAGARLSDTLVLPALFWFCFLLHLHLCSFLLLLLLLFLSSLFLFIYELSVWGFYLKLLRGQRQKKSENWAN